MMKHLLPVPVIFLLLLFFLNFTACDQESRRDLENFEDYGDIYADDFSLETNTSNHPHGWKKSSCFLCHNRQNIHQVDRLKNLVVDLEEIKQQINQNGVASCSKCHGTNGL